MPGKRNANKAKQQQQKGQGPLHLKEHNMPAAKGFSMRQPEPVVSRANSSTRVKNQVLYDPLIIGSSAFNIGLVPTNPGILDPWIANIAKDFEKYRFLHLSMTYVPSQAVTTTPGTVFMAVDYDCEVAFTATLQQISSYGGAVNGRVWDPLSIEVDCARAFNTGGKFKLTRMGPANGPASIFDCCMLVIATMDAADAPIGKLYLNYEVEFTTPRIETPLILHNMALATMTAQSGNFGTSDVPIASAAYGTMDWEANDLNIKLSGIGEFTLPVGLYLVTTQVSLICINTGTVDMVLKNLVDTTYRSRRSQAGLVLTYAGQKVSLTLVDVLTIQNPTASYIPILNFAAVGGATCAILAGGASVTFEVV